MTDTPPLALVTGASSGIGFELARQFTERGYEVVIAAEDELAVIDLNVRSTVRLAKPVVADMAARGSEQAVYHASASLPTKVMDMVARVVPDALKAKAGQLISGR